MIFLHFVPLRLCLTANPPPLRQGRLSHQLNSISPLNPNLKIFTKGVLILKKILTALIFFLILIIQTSMGIHINIFGITPNLLLVFALLMSINSTSFKAGLIGCLCGLAFDFSSDGSIGFYGLVVMYMCIFTSNLSNRFYVENVFASVTVVFVMGFLCEFVSLMFSDALFEEFSLLSTTLRYILPESILNAITALLFVKLTRWLNNEYIRGI